MTLKEIEKFLKDLCQDRASFIVEDGKESRPYSFNVFQLCDNALEIISFLLNEVERLDHLHELDHSLADQWKEKNKILLDRLKKAEEILGQYIGEDGSPECVIEDALDALRGGEER